MTTVTLRKNESRKDYLIRVAIKMLNENGYDMPKEIIYDEAECDALCLAEDLRVEFNLD